MTVRATLSVPTTALPAGDALADGASVDVRFRRAVPLGDRVATLRLTGPGREAALTAVEEHPDLASVDILEEGPGGTLVRVGYGDAIGPVLSAVEASGAVVIGGAGDGDVVRLECLFPDEASLSRCYGELRSVAPDADVDRIEVLDDGAARHAGVELSPAQAETLRLALRRGYFSVPREATVADLAAELGVSEQSVSERLRRGLGAVVSGTLLDDDLDGAAGSRRG